MNCSATLVMLRRAMVAAAAFPKGTCSATSRPRSSDLRDVGPVEVLVQVAHHVGVAGGGREDVDEAEELGLERRVRHGPLEHALGPPRGLDDPRLAPAGQLRQLMGDGRRGSIERRGHPCRMYGAGDLRATRSGTPTGSSPAAPDDDGDLLAVGEGDGVQGASAGASCSPSTYKMIGLSGAQNSPTHWPSRRTPHSTKNWPRVLSTLDRGLGVEDPAGVVGVEGRDARLSRTGRRSRRRILAQALNVHRRVVDVDADPGRDGLVHAVDEHVEVGVDVVLERLASLRDESGRDDPPSGQAGPATGDQSGTAVVVGTVGGRGASGRRRAPTDENGEGEDEQRSVARSPSGV